ncbi:MAG: hypothetical protein ABIA47_04875 [bacterium]
MTTATLTRTRDALRTTAMPRLMGVIKDMPNGYGFISEIVTLDGALFNTNGDVFVHQDESTVPLVVGAKVEFSLMNDPKRSGQFRAMNVSTAADLPAIASDVSDLPALATRRPYHHRAKPVPPEEVRKAVNNKPFKEVIGVEMEEAVHLHSEDEVSMFVRAFLEYSYPGLGAYDVSFDIDRAGEEAEKHGVQTAVDLQRELGFATQAGLIEAEYGLYLATTDMLKSFRDAGVLVPGARMSPTALSMLVGNSGNLRTNRNHASAGSVEEQMRTTALFTGTIRFLRDEGLMQPCSVIPMTHIADLLMAAPVWFIEAKQNLPDTWNYADPRPDAAVQYFAGLLGTQEWADAYQMFNRRTRRLNQYQGDIIPPRILRAIAKARQHFDFVVIATPYVDIAGREWEDPAWQALIDPFLFGFKEGVPYMCTRRVLR